MVDLASNQSAVLELLAHYPAATLSLLCHYLEAEVGIGLTNIYGSILQTDTGAGAVNRRFYRLLIQPCIAWNEFTNGLAFPLHAAYEDAITHGC